jgi:biotin carboxylase
MNKMKKHIAIIGSGEMAVIIADEGKKMGIISHSFSSNPNDRVIGHSDYHHDIDIFETKRLVDVCRNIGIQGVLATTELTVDIAAKVAAELGLSGIPTTISNKVTDKEFVRNKASTVTKIKQPSYYIWEVGNDLPIISAYPVVVKPTSMGGKRGVSVVFSEEELQGAIQYSIKSMPAAKTRLIIESYIPGDKEYSIESLSYNGCHQVIQVTEKISSGPPHCVELGHMQPALISPNMRDKIDKAIAELLTAIGMNNSPAHTEIKIVNDDIYLVEMNPRFGGDHIAYPLTELSTGYPYIQGAIRIAMGEYRWPNIEKFSKTTCGVIFVAKQTEQFKQLFDDIEQYSWLYKKNKVTDGLKEITNNQAFDTNYFIFKADTMPLEVAQLLRQKDPTML